MKRRKSSIADADSHAAPDPDADHDTKRRRLSSQDDQPHSRRPSSAQSPEEPRGDRDRRPTQPAGRGRGRDEERKRGQRLFGALLGTLSQSSNSSAQRRRADIEKRQQDKLKVRYEEFDEERRKRRDEVVAVRRKERWLYEREEVRISFGAGEPCRIADYVQMRTRHSNLRAVTHFLKTRTEPVLVCCVQPVVSVSADSMASTTNRGSYDPRMKT